MSELALQRIAENKAKHARGEDASYLDLGRCGLTEWPDLSGMDWVETLILSNDWWEIDFETKRWRHYKSQNNGERNQIEKISYAHSNLPFLSKLVATNMGISDGRFLEKLTNLNSLNLTSNKISDGRFLEKLTNLNSLDLRENQISDGRFLEKLTNLKSLDLSFNQISDWQFLEKLINLKSLELCSSTISDWRFLEKLINLISLDLSSNQISDCRFLEKLTGLTTLYLNFNQISDVRFLEKLTALTFLNLSYNPISDLQFLEKLANLTSLILSDNQINDARFLEKLTNLNRIVLTNNQLTDLAPLRYFLENKRMLVVWKEWYETIDGEINVKNNPITNPPLEIAVQGTDAVLRYFEELERAKAQNDTIRLSEAKCLILGEGGSGKTSLARKLLHPDTPLPAEKETTQGIDVHPHNLKLPDGSDFRLNIWDFGGQEIYHATHQFFLTKRSLYILLDDTRKDEKTVNDPTFNYWLQVAELYGGGSPLLIVQNEKGDRSKQLDLKGMQGRFGFVKDARAANLLTCRGLDEVWAAIQYWLKQLPHIGEEQPKAWLDIRRELERLAREEGWDFISLEKYYEVCAQHSIPERERALFLSGYLHDFGAFLHFQDHPLLRKMLVLNNQWATDAVYKVLDSEPVKKAFGRFTRADLANIWSDARYADQHDELLALMEKFELCYKLPDEKTETWLAPQLFSVLQPDALVWNESDNLQIRYEYEFMPKGLLSQHIVRMHRYVRQSDLAWKSGVVFERAGSQALVTEAWGSRNIRLRARGPQAKELLTLLAEDFDKMHERLEGLRVKKMIPCNCRACAGTVEPHFYEYDDLARRKSLGKRTIECKISFDDVSVTDLLDGVFAKNMNSPHALFQSGEIEEALRRLLPSDDASLLLGQFLNAEKEFLHQRIGAREFGEVKSKVMAAVKKML